MLFFKKIRARCGLFRSGPVQLQAAQPRTDAAPGLMLAQVRLSTLGVSLDHQGFSNDWMRGGR